MTKLKFGTWLVLGVFAATIGAGSVAARGDDAVDYQKLLSEKSPALVNVKYVFKRGDVERQVEIGGVMIESGGLVLCPARGVASNGATATDMKVLVGDDEEGVEAKVLARDSELDLVWMQVKKPPKEPYAFLDLTKSAQPKLGQVLVAPRRMVKYFDRAGVLVFGRMLGTVHKPRDLYVPGNGLDADLGSPVFTPEGALIGFMVTQSPEREDLESGPIQPIGGMRDYGNMILPAAEVARATERAKNAKGEGEEMSAKAKAAAEKAKSATEAEAEKLKKATEAGDAKAGAVGQAKPSETDKKKSGDAAKKPPAKDRMKGDDDEE